jgi:hypothetical protein
LPEYSIDQALKEIDNVSFSGGTNNGNVVLQALESAATEPGGTVVWLHGPQPLPATFTDLESLGMFNKPRLVDLQIGTDRNEIVNGWKECHLSAFVSYDHVAMDDLASNLDSVLTGYRSGKQSSIVTQELVHGKPNLPISDSPLLAAELSSLWASKAVTGLLDRGDTARAEQIGCEYHIVSPVTGAVALEKQSDYSYNGIKPSRFRAAQTAVGPNPGEIAAGSLGHTAIAVATSGGGGTLVGATTGGEPSVAGATNGTIGPQGADATVVYGVNTAGNVRVNNLANLEALVNIVSNLLECIGLIYGGVALYIAYMNRKTNRAKAKGLIAKAMTVVALAVMIVPTMNWLIASARDANLFS